MKFLTAADMKQEFLIGYDRITNLAAPGYTDNEISLFLNRGQESIIEVNYRGLNRLRQGFEASEKRRQDLSELIRDAVDSSGTLTTAISANQFGNLPNGTFFDLPSDFLYAITERAETDIVCDGVNKVIDIKPITHDMFNINKDNPWKEPYDKLIWRIDYSRVTIDPTIPQRHELISNGSYTITKYFLRYLKKPLEISITNGVNCELDQSLHRDIVGKAVEFALENIMDPRFQSKKLENLEID